MWRIFDVIDTGFRDNIFAWIELCMTRSMENLMRRDRVATFVVFFFDFNESNTRKTANEDEFKATKIKFNANHIRSMFVNPIELFDSIHFTTVFRFLE